MAVNTATFWLLDTEIGFWSAVAFGIVCFFNMPTMIIQGGLTRLMPIPHLVWVPLLVYLYPYLFGPTAIESGDPVYILGIMVFGVNSISLLFDVYESFRWLRGDREILGIET